MTLPDKSQPQSPTPIPARTIMEIISRAAESPNFDVDKLERLIALKDAEEAHQAALAFNTALAAAQGEMGTISHDAVNPMTHSRYATFAQLDRAIRPIYTKHGFGIQFTEEPSPSVNLLRVVAFLSCGRETRRYMRDIPITTQGIRGQAMATPTHANMSAATYGRRALLTMMFNLSTDDDDGNEASPRPRAPQPPAENVMLQRQDESEIVMALDERLSMAADQGTEALQEAWRSLSKAEQKLMEAAKNRRYKPTAQAADKAIAESEFDDSDFPSDKPMEKNPPKA